MILPIVQYGDPVLRKKGDKIASITSEIVRLAENMLETMRAAKGVGLAAQQVGHALQLAVVDVTGVKERPSQLWLKGRPVDPELYMPLILVNPVISGTKTKVAGHEGCLSFPGIGADINRSQRVKVKAQNLRGETLEFDAAGLLGRAIQHEYDHLQGKLFIDLFSAEDRKEWKEEIDALRLATEASLPPKR
jgi:peptide deformylase